MVQKKKLKLNKETVANFSNLSDHEVQNVRGGGPTIFIGSCDFPSCEHGSCVVTCGNSCICDTLKCPRD